MRSKRGRVIISNKRAGQGSSVIVRFHGLEGCWMQRLLIRVLQPGYTIVIPTEDLKGSMQSRSMQSSRLSLKAAVMNRSGQEVKGQEVKGMASGLQILAPASKKI